MKRGKPVGGYAMLGLMLVLFGLLLIGVIIAPNLILKVAEKNRDVEQKRLTRIGNGLVESIQRGLTIPTYTNWSSAVPPFTGLDLTEVQQVNPSFSTDTNLTRVFLIDPNLSSGVLPYTQTPTGLTGSQTNLLGTAARVMLVSNTKRGLTLPVTSGVPSSSNTFNAIWDWVYDPNTKAPPSGWPSSWTNSGQFAHAYRLNLANLFHTVTLKNLLYGSSTNTMTNLVTAQSSFYFLRGTPLALATTNGTLKRLHVVNRDILIDLSGIVALAWWQFSETSGTVATNSGRLGAAANGIYSNGVTLNVAGPRPPTFPTFSTNNTAISLDGVNDYVTTTNSLLNNVGAFTVAGWINPSAIPKKMDMFGQDNIAQVGLVPNGDLALWVTATPQILSFPYPYGVGAWHHIAGVGDGTNMYLYIDGVQLASRAFATASYGSNSSPFTIGGNLSINGKNFNGLIDEVVVYDRALSAAQILQLTLGQVF